REGGEEVLGRVDATQSTRADLAPAVEAQMVFVGYGLRVPEARYDDLAGVDLRGKIAVYVNSPGALDAPGPVKSHVGAASERCAVLRAAGAIGTATSANPRPRAGAGGGRGAAATETPSATDAADGAGADAGRGPAGGRGPQKSFLLADPELQESVGQK